MKQEKPSEVPSEEKVSGRVRRRGDGMSVWID